MNHEYLNNNNWLPFNEGYLFEGVFVLWKLKNKTTQSSPTWHKDMVFDSTDNREFINQLFIEETINEYFGVYEGRGPVNYAVIDKSGNILCGNFETNITKQENGVLTITSPSHPELNCLVLPIDEIHKKGQTIFCNGENLDDLITHIKKALYYKLIKKPKALKNLEKLSELSTPKIRTTYF